MVKRSPAPAPAPLGFIAAQEKRLAAVVSLIAAETASIEKAKLSHDSHMETFHTNARKGLLAERDAIRAAIERFSAPRIGATVEQRSA